MTKEHKTQIIATLKRELGSGKEVSKFSNMLRELGFMDLREDVQLDWAVNNGALLRAMTYYSLGILANIVELKYKEI